MKPGITDWFFAALILGCTPYDALLGVGVGVAGWLASIRYMSDTKEPKP